MIRNFVFTHQGGKKIPKHRGIDNSIFRCVQSHIPPPTETTIQGNVFAN